MHAIVHRQSTVSYLHVYTDVSERCTTCGVWQEERWRQSWGRQVSFPPPPPSAACPGHLSLSTSLSSSLCLSTLKITFPLIFLIHNTKVFRVVQEGLILDFVAIVGSKQSAFPHNIKTIELLATLHVLACPLNTAVWWLAVERNMAVGVALWLTMTDLFCYCLWTNFERWPLSLHFLLSLFISSYLSSSPPISLHFLSF